MHLQVDRDTARLDGQVEDELFELFLQLSASDSQMDFPILFASAKAGMRLYRMHRCLSN